MSREVFNKKHFKEVGKFDWEVEGKSISIPPFNYAVLEDPEDALVWIEKIFEEGTVGVDTETNTLNWEMPELSMHGFSLANKDWAVYVHGRAGVNKEVLNLLEEKLNDPEKTHAWYNYNFDRHVLAQYGIKYDYGIGNVEDVQVMTSLDNRQDLHPHSRGGLKGEAQLYLKSLEHKPPSFKDLHKHSNNILDIDPDIFYRYGAYDARLTYDLYQAIKTILKNVKDVRGEKTLYEYYREIPMKVLHPLYKMEDHGMYIDKEKLDEIIEDTTNIEETTTKFWTEVTGANPQSRKQKAHFFFDVLEYPVEFFTEEENRSTNELTMRRLVSSGDPFADLYINVISPANKIRTTYAEPFKEKIQKLGEPYIHGNLDLFITRTGRLSSSNPNLQNIPSKGEWGDMMRELFSAPPGYWFLRADYSQLELRILAHYTKDPVMLEVFNSGGDIHQETADRMGVGRDEAKVFNFGIVYGMTGWGVARNYEKYGLGNISKEEGDELIKHHLAQFPKVKEWLNKVYVYSKQLGYSQTIGGRRRYLPNINSSDNKLAWKAKNKASNFIIQGSAADIMDIGIYYADKLFISYNKKFNDGSRLVNTVHDEIVGYVNRENEDRARNLANRTGDALSFAGEYFDLLVNLDVEPDLGENWKETK